jgi:hypothetical protein
MGDNQVAWAMAAVVVIALIGFMAYQYMQQQAAAQRARDPGLLLGQGIGNVVSGIVGLATQGAS